MSNFKKTYGDNYKCIMFRVQSDANNFTKYVKDTFPKNALVEPYDGSTRHGKFLFEMHVVDSDDGRELLRDLVDVACDLHNGEVPLQ